MCLCVERKKEKKKEEIGDSSWLLIRLLLNMDSGSQQRSVNRAGSKCNNKVKGKILCHNIDMNYQCFVSFVAFFHQLLSFLAHLLHNPNVPDLSDT